MRDFLNAILLFIEATALTDEEFATIDLSVEDYSVETYNALVAVIDSRELVSTTRDRLTSYFEARGTTVVEPTAGRSNIYVGSVLCD